MRVTSLERIPPPPTRRRHNNAYDDVFAWLHPAGWKIPCASTRALGFLHHEHISSFVHDHGGHDIRDRFFDNWLVVRQHGRFHTLGGCDDRTPDDTDSLRTTRDRDDRITDTNAFRLTGLHARYIPASCCAIVNTATWKRNYRDFRERKYLRNYNSLAARGHHLIETPNYIKCASELCYPKANSPSSST